MDASQWFDQHVYGTPPPPPLNVALLEAEDQPVVRITGPGGELILRLLLRLPDDPQPAPCVIGLNFEGNDATLPGQSQASRWPYSQITERGFAVATCWADDIDADRLDFTDGVHRIMQLPVDPRPSDGTGTLAAWAWGLSQIRRALCDHPRIDSERIAVIGHSRMGKAALLAASRDEYFAAAISNCSGFCGAALHRGKQGERIEHGTNKFSYWYAPAFAQWVGRDDELPFDQDALIGLIKPRPVLILSAQDDSWADPEAERRCAEKSGASYRCRTGEHELTEEDWRDAMDFLTHGSVTG